MQKILILCTGNSCRSHMAEGLLKHLASDLFEVFSAGSNPAGIVHPLAIEVLKEKGIDISLNTSKSLNLFINVNIDIVITVCDNAKEACPVFPNSPKTLHWPFEDPPHAQKDGENEIDAFRRIRDQIELKLNNFVNDYRKNYERKINH